MKAPILIVTCAALLGSVGVAWAVEAAPFPLDQRSTLGGEPSYKTATENELGLHSPGSSAMLSLAGTVLPFWGGILLSKNEGAGGAVGRYLASGPMMKAMPQRVSPCWLSAVSELPRCMTWFRCPRRYAARTTGAGLGNQQSRRPPAQWTDRAGRHSGSR